MALNIEGPAPNNWLMPSLPPEAKEGTRTEASPPRKNFLAISRGNGQMAEVRQAPGERNKVSQTLTGTNHARPDAKILEQAKRSDAEVRTGTADVQAPPKNLLRRLFSQSGHAEPAPPRAEKELTKLPKSMAKMRILRPAKASQQPPLTMQTAAAKAADYSASLSRIDKAALSDSSNPVYNDLKNLLENSGRIYGEMRSAGLDKEAVSFKSNILKIAGRGMEFCPQATKNAIINAHSKGNDVTTPGNLSRGNELTNRLSGMIQPLVTALLAQAFCSFLGEQAAQITAELITMAAFQVSAPEAKTNGAAARETAKIGPLMHNFNQAALKPENIEPEQAAMLGKLLTDTYASAKEALAEVRPDLPNLELVAKRLATAEFSTNLFLRTVNPTVLNTDREKHQAANVFLSRLSQRQINALVQSIGQPDPIASARKILTEGDKATIGDREAANPELLAEVSDRINAMMEKCLAASGGDPAFFRLGS